MTGAEICGNFFFMKTQSLKNLACGLAFALLLYPLVLGAAESSPQNEPPAQPSVGEDLGYGVGSVLANVFYMPAKLIYAGLGVIGGGLGYVLSGGNTETATSILDPAVRGNYVVTPSHLKGEEPLVFVGPIHSSEPQQPEQAPPSNPPPSP